MLLQAAGMCEGGPVAWISQWPVGVIIEICLCRNSSGMVVAYFCRSYNGEVLEPVIGEVILWGGAGARCNINSCQLYLSVTTMQSHNFRLLMSVQGDIASVRGMLLEEACNLQGNCGKIPEALLKLPGGGAHVFLR